MTVISKILIIIIVATASGCSLFGDNEQMNAIIDRTEFKFVKGRNKLDQVKSIENEQIHGEWEILTSLFTITFQNGSKGNTTFGMEGNTLKIESNGKLTYSSSDHSSSGKWSLTDDKTVFNQIFNGKITESHKIRVIGDTMEWIMPIIDGEDLMYFVLARK